MRNGTCPECKSTDVYFGSVQNVKGGLRDEHQVFIPSGRSHLYADTYICVSCGAVRLFLDEKSMQEAADVLPNSKDWKKVK